MRSRNGPARAFPTETEWELAANDAPLWGNFVENRRWHPDPPPGGSGATPVSPIRASYRNFFSPAARWQLTGLRLANDV